MTLETDVSPVDILGDIPGIELFEGLWLRDAVKEIYELAVYVASVADLLAMKRAANRPKDQAHILELLELQKLLETAPNPEH